MSGGLRERKKARTRAAIQDAALRLFAEQGYQATTVEQIAEAADVSQATFFRYYPTKEDTVLYDRLDPVFIDAFLNQPAELSPVTAVRAAVNQVFTSLSPEAFELEMLRIRLVVGEPRLRGALANQLEEGTTMLVNAVAKRVDREPDDLEVVTYTGAIVGGIYAAFLASVSSGGADMLAVIDRSLAYLESGLEL